METRVLSRLPIGNPRRAWRQDRFILSTFRGVTGDIRTGFNTLKDAHFNLLEFGWVPSDKTDDAIAIAEEVGVDVLVQDWRHFGGFQESHSREIDPEDIQAYVRRCQKYHHIYGYYVWDEPYFPEDIEKAAAQTDVMARLDPERMPFTVAIPSYNKAYTYGNGQFDEYLERFVNRIDPPVMSLDYYPFAFHPNDETQLDGSGLYKDLYLMRKWSLKKQLPLWFYYQGTEALGPCSLTTRQIDMQAHTALLYGAKALQHYTVVGSVIREDGTPGDFFQHQKKLNTRIENWGRTLMALTSTGVYHSAEVLANDPDFRTSYCDDFAESALFAGELPRRISLGEFTDPYGNRYAMVVNRDYLAPQTVSLPLSAPMRVYEVSDQDGYQSLFTENAASLDISLSPGGARLFRMQDPGQEPYLIDYRLEK